MVKKMKKTAGVLAIVIFCIGMLTACAGKENIDTITSHTEEYLAEELDIGGMQETMVDGTKADTETEEFTYETQTLYAMNGEKQLYGIVYIPQNAGEQMPAVIYSHGFGGTHHSGAAYADILARNGYVVYCFDFCGGGPGSKSDGSMTEMSLLTEQSDLEAVLSMIQELPYVDGNSIVLLGESQGGAVSAVTSAAHKDEVDGLILLYPAFVMADNTRKEFSSLEDIPETYTLMGMIIGRRYAEDLLDYDFYQVIGQYDKDVLLLHGDSDRIVPVSYSERAVQVYPSAQLEIFSGTGHGFYGNDVEKAADYILEYMKEQFG